MSDFFNEVEEDVRAKDAQAIFKRSLPWIIGAVVVIVIGTGAFWGWTVYTRHEANVASEAYDKGLKDMQNQNTAAADAAFAEAAKTGNGAYKSLALSQRAGILVSQNRTDEAVKMLDEAAKAARNPIEGDLASLKAAWLVMDKAPYADVEKRLTPLTGKDRPYRAYAKEALAMAKLMVPSKVKDAKGDFELLSVSPDAPQDIQRRAQAALGLIESGAAGQVAAVVKAAAQLPPPGSAGAPNPFASAAPQGAPSSAQSGAPQQ